MVLKYTSVVWEAVAPAVANHLWQSTLFAIIAGLLTLTLRRNQARARYWLWLAASVKFLIPFSLLVIIGSHLARPSAELRSAPASGIYFAAQEVATVSDFLTVGLSHGQKPRVNPKAVDRGYPLVHLLPALLATAWLCGFVAVLLVWLRRWRRMSRAMREAAPLREGREVEALCRLERIAGIRKPIQLLLSQGHLEPGIFGIIRPVLVWPQGISERLKDAQLEAILAHELWHVRRRDNLAAALHMAVETVFWFHPLVWWLGGRLVEERERACDEAVLQWGNEPKVYAESILKTCEFCVGSPLACVSGVTGADLKKRIVRIMTQRAARRLDLQKKLLLGVAGFLAIAVPIGFGLANGQAGQANAPQSSAAQGGNAAASSPKFEVASIKPAKPGARVASLLIPPGRFTATNLPLKMIIEWAYKKGPGFELNQDQIKGGPSWINSERLDIDAKVEDSLVQEEEKKLPFDQWADQIRLMVRSMLVERFTLKAHYETRELPIYALVVAKHGPKLTESKQPPPGPLGFHPPGPRTFQGMRLMGRGGLIASGVTISQLADALSNMPELGRRVVADQTRLKGRYDFTLKWAPEMARGGMFGNPGPKEAVGSGGGAGPMAEMPPAPGSSNSSAPSIFTALQEQLGLKLKPEKGPVEVLVIDHVEKPTPN